MSNMKTKKLPPKVESMTKEELLLFLKKKKECETIAQNIVIDLLDSGIYEEKLMECLPHINQCHYDDIVEERAIIKLCGYPICNKPLPAQLPKQQYRISSKTNKVFDITLRKNFCSNRCYTASSYLKRQLLTCPLWCREVQEMPHFTLMPIHVTEVLGEEIDLSLIKKVEPDTNKENSFHSLLDFTEASLTEISQDTDSKHIELQTVEVSNASTDRNESRTDIESTTSEINVEQRSSNNCKKTNTTLVTCSQIPQKKSGKKINNSCKIIGDVVEKRSENKIDPIISEGIKLAVSKRIQETKEISVKTNELNIGKSKNKLEPITVSIIHMEKCIGEWFTLESMIFLFGEEHVKEIVTDKGDHIKEYLNNMANGLFYKSTAYDQYQQICRKLNLLELEDRRYDNKTTAIKEMKPLPEYSMLQEESKNLDIKVRAFYKGELEIPATKHEEDNVQDNEEFRPNLPLIDKTAQNALRRKLLLNSFNKALPDLLQSLGISAREINTDLKLLVATFNLQAHNIVFKPQQWNMIAMIIIKLLSIKDVRLKKALEADKANRHMQLLLMSYEQDGGYLDRIISWLVDIDRLLEKNNTQLTVES